MDFESVARFALMAFGIGLVIFVHELGHFIAARICKVRVETFSMGFGPKLISKKHGDTLYQLALLPIGGFVRMAGEDALQERRTSAPDELLSKSVGQRFFIYSGGVLMNIAFALIVLPLVLFHGVPMNEPVIGSVEPGSGAWHARIEPGSRVLRVNGVEIPSFEYIAQEVALGPSDSSELELVPPGETEPRSVRAVPRYIEDYGVSMIGVRAAPDPSGAIEVAPGSAAADAGLKSDERILSIDGPLPHLPLAEQLAFAMERRQTLQLEVAGADGSRRSVALVPKPNPERRIFGILPAFDIVLDLRTNADVEATGLQRGDRIVSVNGRRIIQAHDLELALIAGGAQPLQLEVERAGERRSLSGPTLARERALAFAADIALESNLAQREIALHDDSAAERAGLLAGDRLLVFDGTLLADWDQFLELAGEASRAGRAARISVEREDSAGELAQHEFEVTPAPLAEYGLGLREALYTYRADSFREALGVGTKAAWKFLLDTWNTLKRMLLGEVSSKNLGGVITIGVVSYSWAEYGIAKLLFFLCIISVQLAFLNVLPIPLLDGGHLFFLVIEKLKGSPVSERVLGYSQMVGLVLILSLVIYVTFQDVVRWGVIDKIFGP